MTEEQVYKSRQLQHASVLEFHEADIAYLKQQLKNKGHELTLVWLAIALLAIGQLLASLQ